jgi:hypothetical protein
MSESTWPTFGSRLAASTTSRSDCSEEIEEMLPRRGRGKFGGADHGIAVRRNGRRSSSSTGQPPDLPPSRISDQFGEILAHFGLAVEGEHFPGEFGHGFLPDTGPAIPDDRCGRPAARRRAVRIARGERDERIPDLLG